MTKMIRMSDEMSVTLDEIAKDTGDSKQNLLAQAINMLRRDYFLKKTNKEFAALRKDPKAWKEELEERDLWDATLLDGLEDANDKY